MAMTAVISRRVKPAVAPAGSPPCDLMSSLSACRGDIGGGAGPALLPVGAIGDDLIGAAFSGRTIHIGFAPGVIGHRATLQVRAVPCRKTGGRLHKGNKALRARRVTARVQIEQIKRA